MSFSPTAVFERAQAGKPVSTEEAMLLTQYYSDSLDFLQLLPLTLKLNGKPMDVESRRPMFAPLFRKKRRSKREIYKCGRQVAKALALDTPVPTPTGWTTMGDIAVGDWVLGDDGKPVRVTFVSPIMNQHECYRIKFDCGEEIVADAGHLWSTWDLKSLKSYDFFRKKGGPPLPANKFEWRSKTGVGPSIRTTEEIFNTQRVRKQVNHLIPLAAPLDLPHRKLPLDPWALGYLLGDGDTSGSGRAACHPDARNEIRELFEVAGLKTTSQVSPGHFGVLGLRSVWRKLGLEKGKRVPETYLRASFDQRLALLQGLIDSDGGVDNHGSYRFDNTNEGLVDSVVELASSLGLVARKFLRSARKRNKSLCKPSFCVSICSHIPLARTKAKVAAARHAWNREQVSCRIVSVIPEPSVPVRCIKVDNASHLFLAGRKMIPTHNTTSAAGSMMMNLIWREYFRIMYVAPLAIYTQRLHQIHFDPFIRNCTLPWPVQDKSCVNNVNSKTFVSNSHFHGVSCFNSAGNAIGVAIDWVNYDEVQDLNIEFIPQIRETLRTSNFRWESYFGTARGVENTIQVLFDESSGGEWFIKCVCGLWVEPTLEKHAISMIQKHGIACPKCSRLLEFETGQWVHRFPDRIEEFAGYHIPATIVRDVCSPLDRYLDTIYNKLYGISRYSEAKFLQEILGISSDQGGRPITPEEIKRASVLEWPAWGIQLDEYSNICGGADWGGSEIVSFTVGTAVGWHYQTGKFHCLGATRPMGIPDNERHLPLATFFKKTAKDRILGIAADAGFVGGVQNRNLEKVSGIRTASIAYGTKKAFFQALQGRNFIVDRTTLIYITYALIREGHLLLPKGVEFEQFSNDLTATFIEDIEAPNGMTSRRYCRYKQRADDFLHALGYAVFLCAITAGIDLTAMLGLGAKTSLNARFTDASGDEGDAVFANWQNGS